jgi:hypothetical protein
MHISITGSEVPIPSLCRIEMAYPTRERRRHNRRSCLGWCCCPTPRWKLLNRASKHGPRPVQSLAVLQLQVCIHHVLRNHIGIDRPDQSLPNWDPSPASRHQDQHSSLARTPSFRENASDQKSIHVYIAGRAGSLGMERFSRRNPDAWRRCWRSTCGNCKYAPSVSGSMQH